MIPINDVRNPPRGTGIKSKTANVLCQAHLLQYIVFYLVEQPTKRQPVYLQVFGIGDWEKIKKVKNQKANHQNPENLSRDFSVPWYPVFTGRILWK